MNLEKTVEMLSKVYQENVKAVVKANFEEEFREILNQCFVENNEEIITDIEIIDIYLRVLRECRRVNLRSE